ncbi:MAG: hypothetical protein DRP15_03630 [Candidatus Aenigmatarchaeota archaeon]|nr:MAG: hypothetical protein DRP15_03630 [Candidatus Aenigmarchaeota archaeon]
MTTLVLAAVVLLVAAGTVSADTEIKQADIPFTASAAGERYYLDGDLTCANTASAITIGANNVIIDGQGYKITGAVAAGICSCSEGTPDSTHSGVVNVAGYNNVIVKDLEIEYFCTGVSIGSGAGEALNMTVTGCKIHDGGEDSKATHGVHLGRASYCNISKNEIYNIAGGPMSDCGGGGNGVFMYGVGPTLSNHNTVDCNYIHNNAKSGIFSKKVSRYNTFSNNKVTDNAQYGIAPMCKQSRWCTIEHNYVKDNSGGGYASQASNNTIRFNTFIDNGNSGLNLKSSDDPDDTYGGYNIVTNNTICGHSYRDINSQAGQGETDTLESNTCNTTDYGGCDWSCSNLVSVYYDYDQDVPLGGAGNYSAETCSCGTLLGVGACCNPGLFNETGAGDHCDYEPYGYDLCILTPGTDANDCAPVPEVATFTLFGLGLVGLVGYIRVSGRRKD